MTAPTAPEPRPTCWFHKFGGGEPCGNPGVYGWRDVPDDTLGVTVVRQMRWCEVHRHDTDVRISEVPDDNARA